MRRKVRNSDGTSGSAPTTFLGIRDGIDGAKIPVFSNCCLLPFRCSREVTEQIVLNSQYEIEFSSSPGNPHEY
jgi:hypothetical protein